MKKKIRRVKNPCKVYFFGKKGKELEVFASSKEEAKKRLKNIYNNKKYFYEK